MRMPRHTLSLSAALIVSLSACSTLERWLGDESRNEEPIVPGERISVLNISSDLTEDPSLASSVIDIGAAANLSTFPHEMAAQQGGIDSLALSGFETEESEPVGEGNAWESELIPQPVIAQNMVFVMDAHGVISAHDINDVSRVLWTSATALTEETEEMTGGGLAYSGGVLYATIGSGSLIALVASDGSLLWRQNSDVPFRAPPTAAGDKVYAITIDNQLSAFSARTGEAEWTHRGIRESAVYLGSAAPAIENDIVVAAYSSGELFAFRGDDGLPIWSDSLNTSRRTSASAVLTGIAATPLIRDNAVFAVSNNGLMTASLLSSGRGLWDVELSSTHTPWLAGDYLFVLSTDGKLLALNARQKSVKWLNDLKTMVDDGEPLPRFTAPMMINGALTLFHHDGEAWRFDPQTGAPLEPVDVPDGIYGKPAFAAGKLFVVTQDATLHQLQ